MPSLLKSLELQGYKTFANRTLFEFANTITAIVGPNGSGKSNIADSLRWVLGEQSYSLLRARKTEDMIFSGSENRPRAGFATATVIFDNSDGWLPIDFSEVAIARRAHRDGQNEYLINGQRVRLKDVSELLARSGLAERTYTVIGQGLVDAALSLKAEERRRLFEEAAGIGLHRSRREEALRRLEATRRNLERVQDIMAELRPRLRSLERQARRAGEYSQVRTDLQVLLREYYGFHWHRAQRDLADARAAANTQQQNLEQANQANAEMEAKLGDMRGRSLQVRESLNQWHRQLAGLHSQREAINRHLAVAAERSRSLDERENSGRAQLANRRQEMELYLAQAEQSGAESTRLEAELDEIARQGGEAKEMLAARQEARAAAVRTIEGLHSELASLNSRQGQLEALLSERNNQEQKNQAALMDAAAAAKTTEAEALKAMRSYQTAQKELAGAQSGLENIDGELQTARQGLDEHTAKRQAALDELSEVKARLARLGAEMDVLEQAEAAMSGYASGTRLLLEAAKKGSLPGAQDALSSRLEVPSGLEAAFSAALGDFLDAVLLGGDQDAALDMLNGKGERGVVLPLGVSPVKIDVDRSRCNQEDVLGIAADMVKYADGLQGLVGLLLGAVYIVRHRAAARRVLEGQTAPARAVTLKGEVFYAGGPVQVSGGEGDAGARSLLGRKRRRVELQEQMMSAEKDQKQLSAALIALDEDLGAARLRLSAMDSGYQRARQEAGAALNAMNQAKLAQERAEQQAEWQARQVESLQTDLERGRAEIEGMMAEATGLDSSLEQVRQRIRHANSALAELALDEFQSQAAHWNTRAAVSERALTDSKARLAERQAALERAQKAAADIQARLQEIEAARQQNLDEQIQQRQAETGLAEEIKKLQMLIEPAEAELQVIEKQADGYAEAEVKSRQRLSQAEHFNAQTRIELARRQEGLHTLQRRIEDDLGLVAYEYEQQISGPTPLPLEGLVEQLPVVRSIAPELEENLKRQRAQLRRMGAINPEAQQEYQEVKERYEFMTAQIEDLRKAELDVRQVIAELDELMQREFRKTFDAVAAEFRQIFTRLFDGGSARLVLSEPDDLTVSGIDIEARLPGRRTQGLSLLSGGERSLTATALVFSLLKVSPTPFCVLDEVDAMLDESNVGRFRDLLRELSANTQFVIVTHNRNTVQAADVIYGVTMGRDTSSQVLSLKLDEVSQVVS